jgi:AraC-like DNA-binding protein
VHNNQLLTHHWDRSNRYTFSTVSDFHEYATKKSTETGLKYVISGEEEYVVHNRSHRVKLGGCLVINEDRMIDVHVKKSEAPVLGICISLDNRLLNDIFTNHILTEEKLIDKGHAVPSDELNFFESVFNAGDDLCNYLESLALHQSQQTGEIFLPSEEIFFGIGRHLLLSQMKIKKQSLRIDAMRPATRMELFRLIENARQKIEDEPFSDISIADLASAVCMSEYHFYRTFRQALGVSPNQYRIKVKIERARQMLLQTKMPLHEIADATGFVDEQNLSKVFKRYFAMPPGKYRSSR